MFATGSLARRIERAEAALIRDGVRAAARRPGSDGAFVVEIRGGVAAFSEADCPFNKVAGLGFEGVPDESELSALERRYADRGCPVMVELSSFADPEIGRLLTRSEERRGGKEGRSGWATMLEQVKA